MCVKRGCDNSASLPAADGRCLGEDPACMHCSRRAFILQASEQRKRSQNAGRGRPAAAAERSAQRQPTQQVCSTGATCSIMAGNRCGREEQRVAAGASADRESTPLILGNAGEDLQQLHPSAIKVKTCNSYARGACNCGGRCNFLHLGSGGAVSQLTAGSCAANLQVGARPGGGGGRAGQQQHHHQHHQQ